MDWLTPALLGPFAAGTVLGVVNWVSGGFAAKYELDSVVFWPVFGLFFWYVDLTNERSSDTLFDRIEVLLDRPVKGAQYGFALIGTSVVLLYILEAVTSGGMISVPHPARAEPGSVGAWTSTDATFLSMFLYFHVGHYAGLGAGGLLFSAIYFLGSTIITSIVVTRRGMNWVAEWVMIICRQIKHSFQRALSAIVGLVQDINSGIVTLIGQIFDGFVAFARSTVTLISDLVNGLISKIDLLRRTVLRAVTDAWDAARTAMIRVIGIAGIVLRLPFSLVGSISSGLLRADSSAEDNVSSDSSTPEEGKTDTTQPDRDTSKVHSETSRESASFRSTRVPDISTTASPPPKSLSYRNIEKVERIGRGGNADVYRATAHTSSGALTIALKEPRVQGTIHSEVVDRFATEAETWQKLNDHDHIVGVVDYGVDHIPWLALEYMDGGNLATAADEMSFPAKRWTATKTTEAVLHAHEHGVGHLDLKPENIMLRSTAPGTYDVPKIGDWGLAKLLLEHSKSVEGYSPQYAAPEQFDPDTYGPPNKYTDVYQLGAIFYELFTGRPPFQGQTAQVMYTALNEDPRPPSEIANVPPELDELLLTALAKEKEDRYESVLYMRDGLQQLAFEEPTH